MILRSGTVLDYAVNLIVIGELYYASRSDIDRINQLRDQLWSSDSGTSYEDTSNPEIARLEQNIYSRMERAMEIATDTKKQMENARMRLDSEGFEDELEVVEQYIRIMGKELELEQNSVDVIVQDRELPPAVSDRPFIQHVENLLSEMTVKIRMMDSGTVAVSGFSMKDRDSADILDLLYESALVEFGAIDTLTLVERTRLDDVLVEQKLHLSGLVDTDTAIRIGAILAADNIVTGTVIEMATSVVIFGRVINVESVEVESVAQVIVPKDREVVDLLDS